MTPERIFPEQPTWWSGILRYTGVSSASFDELHVTVTNSSAACGQGFHLSAYKNRNKVGSIYYSYNTQSHKEIKIAQGKLRPWGNHSVITNSIYYGTFIDHARTFYRECFGIGAPQQTFDLASDFPSLTPSQPSTPQPSSQPPQQPVQTIVLPNPLAVPSWVPQPNAGFSLFSVDPLTGATQGVSLQEIQATFNAPQYKLF